MFKKLVLFNIITLCNVYSNISINSLNDKKIIFFKDNNYSFLVTGHIYGAPSKEFSQYPSSSILGSINNLNRLDSKFLILCGDTFRKTDDVLISNFTYSFANNIKFPIFNAVGNHDVSDRQKYESYFGETYFDINYGNEIFIFLDTELKKQKDIDMQVNYFQKKINNVNLDDKVKNVFIISHKLIWAQLFPKYRAVFDNVNSIAGYNDQKYFAKDIINSLKIITKNKNVFWFSGDIGVSWSLPIFYHFDADLNLTFIANGIGDTDNDFIIKTDVKKSEITFSALNISNYDNKLVDIKDYGLSYWNTHAKSNSSMGLIKKVKGVLSNRLFHYGFFVGIVIFLLFIPILFIVVKKKTFL